MVSSPTRYLVFFQYFGTKYSGVMETSNDQAIVGVQNYLQGVSFAGNTLFLGDDVFVLKRLGAQLPSDGSKPKFQTLLPRIGKFESWPVLTKKKVVFRSAPAAYFNTLLWKAAENLKPVVPIKFYISSRTDTGVHALCNAAHFDIQRAPGKPAFNEKQLIYSLNYHLKSEPIRILNVFRVANSFHARFSALSRTYVYRLLMGCTHHSQIPVFEKDLCWAPPGGYLNVPAMQDAAQFLLGTHDFSTFRSLNSETPFQSPVRTILQADIRPSSGFLSHHYEHRGLEFWELKFRSRSFLYRQVRRMVGALVAVGQGKLTPRQIKELLEMKDSRAFPPNAMAPPSGLFLKSVEYNEADLDTTDAPGE